MAIFCTIHRVHMKAKNTNGLYFELSFQIQSSSGSICNHIDGKQSFIHWNLKD